MPCGVLLGLVGLMQMSLGVSGENKKEMMPKCVGKWTNYAMCNTNSLLIGQSIMHFFVLQIAQSVKKNTL